MTSQSRLLCDDAGDERIALAAVAIVTAAMMAMAR
jgi:hypothetical protein